MTNRVSIRALADWLRQRDDIVLLGHVAPDGDAVGSCLALARALRAMGKRAVVCLPEGVPLLYASLPGAEAVVPTGDPLPFMPRAALAVDVSEAPRMGEAGLKLFDGCEHRAALDHHNTNPGFGQLCMLDGEAAAAGELAVDLIDALGVQLDAAMAECLFVAISTDCGQFSYSNTRPQTFRAAARCAETGIEIDRITEALYRTRTRGRTRLLGLALSTLEISPDGELAWSRVTLDMLRRAEAQREDKEGIVNYLMEMEGVRVAVLAEEKGPNETKFSLRSEAPINVATDIAAPLGGGGHDRAAGINMAEPLEPALARVLALAREVISKSSSKRTKP